MTTAQLDSSDRPLLGILLMFGFCVLAPLGDAVAKILGGTIPLIELLLVRFFAQAALMLPIVWYSNLTLRMERKVFWLSTIRTILHIVGIGLMFLALRYLPLADAVAIAFVMPFIMLLLGRYVLGEQVGWRRLAACVVGFCGTLLVIQPSFVNVGAAALLPLGVAFIFAFFILVTRQLARDVDPIALQASNGVMAVILLSVIYLAGRDTGISDMQLVWPSQTDALLMAATGVMGTSAHLLMTWSLRFAPASTLAPMQYLEIPIATFFGWLIFKDLPNGLAAWGIMITIAAGLYVIYREHLTQKHGAPAQ
ncbi:MAG: DMT family transporter [Pseudomonadota bacterium]